MAKKLDVLRDSSVEELAAKVVGLRAELSKEKAQVASGTRAEKPAKIRDVRRQIARILTIINEKKSKYSANALGQKSSGAEAKIAKAIKTEVKA